MAHKLVRPGKLTKSPVRRAQTALRCNIAKPTLTIKSSFMETAKVENLMSIKKQFGDQFLSEVKTGSETFNDIKMFFFYLYIQFCKFDYIVIFLDIAINILLIVQFFFYIQGIDEFIGSKMQFTDKPYVRGEFAHINSEISAGKSEGAFQEWYERWIYSSAEVIVHYLAIKFILGLS